LSDYSLAQKYLPRGEVADSDKPSSLLHLIINYSDQQIKFRPPLPLEPILSGILWLRTLVLHLSECSDIEAISVS
jgi:hypothetical protein